MAKYYVQCAVWESVEAENISEAYDLMSDNSHEVLFIVNEDDENDCEEFC